MKFSHIIIKSEATQLEDCVSEARVDAHIEMPETVLRSFS